MQKTLACSPPLDETASKDEHESGKAGERGRTCISYTVQQGHPIQSRHAIKVAINLAYRHQPVP